MPAPILLLYVFELHHQLAGRFTLDVLHHFTRRDVRWTRQKDVNVFAADGTLKDLDIMSLTYLTNQRSNPKAHFTRQNWLPIFRYPDEVVLEVVTAM